MAFSFGSTATTSAATGFSFGSTAATTAATGFSFGAPKTTAASTGLFGAAAATTTASTGFSFGKTTAAAPAATTGFTFGSAAASTAPAASAAASGGLFGGAFGAKTTAAASTGLFGAATATTAASTGLFGTAAPTTAATAASTKPLENPKEANVPAELTSLVTDLETYIKTQKDVKEEISKISSEGISTVREEISTLKEGIALIANSLQRDAIAAENLKSEVGQELKNAEIVQRIKDPYVGLHHEVAAPMEYFQRLVYSFETRISVYRREIEELETFISSSVSPNKFTPQDLSNILKTLNDSFIGLASELQQVHEAMKILKEKYLHFRRVRFNDSHNPFAARKKQTDAKVRSDLAGPSPFPVVQGAELMALAFKPDVKSSSVTFNTLPGLSSKATGTGLTRSLSFGGSAGKSAFGGSSLFGKTSTAATTTGFQFGAPSTASTPFQLQKPPSGKRGKIF